MIILSALFRSGDALQHELLLWFHAFRGYGVLSEKAAVCDKSWNHSDDHRLENPVPVLDESERSGVSDGVRTVYGGYLYRYGAKGQARWIYIGPLSFQPSEFAKLAVIIFLATVIYKTDEAGWGILRRWSRSWRSCFPFVGVVAYNNLSTAIIILGIAVCMLFVASPKYSHFLIVGGVVLAVGVIFIALASYRAERIQIWLHPEEYEKGYQTLQGLYAIGSGGLFGKGLGESMQKLGFIPEAQNDMIFSVICEELGLFGCNLPDPFIPADNLEIYGDSEQCSRSLRGAACGRHHGAYFHPGGFEYCRCDQHHSEYRDFPSVCQLRWNLHSVSALGNGACAVRVKGNKV